MTAKTVKRAYKYRFYPTEGQEALIQDFMSLLASFSGKFYRLRGWEQQKRFLSDVNNEVRSRAD